MDKKSKTFSQLELELTSWSNIWLVMCFFEETAFVSIHLGLAAAGMSARICWLASRQVFDGITYCCCRER